MNVKEEINKHTNGRPIQYIRLTVNDYLIEGEWDQIKDSLDIEYSSGYGNQELHGVIWYEDGTWSDRVEYDGSEWWEHRALPAIKPTDEYACVGCGSVGMSITRTLDTGLWVVKCADCDTQSPAMGTPEDALQGWKELTKC